MDPGPLAQRAAQRLEHPLRRASLPIPLTAVNESHPASRAAIATAITHATVNRTPRRSRGSGSRASQSHSDAGGPGSGENAWAAVTDWTGNGATFRTEKASAIPV